MPRNLRQPDGQAFLPIGLVRAQERVAVRGVILSGTPVAMRGCPACRYALGDATGELDLMFLGRSAVRGLELGRSCTVEGRAATRNGRIVLWNPRYQLECKAGPGASGDGDCEFPARPRSRSSLP